MPQLDIYLLATQGQFSKRGRHFITSGAGWEVFVEEQIIDVPVGGGSDSADYGLDTVKKKEISLHVKIEDGTVYNKTIIVDNINLSVRSIKQEDNHIFLSVSDITSEDRKIELIKVDILD